MTLFISSVYIITAQEMKFSVKDLVTFTDEIRNGKLYFLCRVNCAWYQTYSQRFLGDFTSDRIFIEIALFTQNQC